MRRKQIWVSDRFAKLIKRKAVENDDSMIKYTDKIAQDFECDMPLFEDIPKKKKKRTLFDELNF